MSLCRFASSSLSLLLGALHVRCSYIIHPVSSFVIVSSSTFLTTPHHGPSSHHHQFSTTTSTSHFFSSSGGGGGSGSSTVKSSGDVTSSSTTSSSSGNNDNDVLDTSTLTLLEHINLNVPNHTHILPFYINILGCGLDPRRAANVAQKSGTIWANCGVSQFHLPHGETAQVIPGHIGLRYDDLNPLKRRLEEATKRPYKEGEMKCFRTYSVGIDERSQNEYVRIEDHYGNIFYCRAGPPTGPESLLRQQPIVYADNTDDIKQFGAEVTKRYGARASETTECKGIDYVEFNIPRNTAKRIAQFYDGIFDATTSIYTDPQTNDMVAIIGFGTINKNGKPQQSLLFRETDATIPPYDGHHIALYVGHNSKDFEIAFQNCYDAKVVWVNTRFNDKAMTMKSAKVYRQFRFKNLVDLRTGKTIYTLEHEVRSVENDAFPGGRK